MHLSCFFRAEIYIFFPCAICSCVLLPVCNRIFCLKYYYSKVPLYNNFKTYFQERLHIFNKHLKKKNKELIFKILICFLSNIH